MAKSIEYGISKPKGSFERRPCDSNKGGQVQYYGPASKFEKKAGKPSRKN